MNILFLSLLWIGLPACGAGSFTFACPHGLQGGCQVTLEQILDIQLTLYEAMLQHEVDKKN